MNILVKGNNWLGDAVMSLPTLKSLKAMAPKARVTVLTKPSFADLYRGAPYVDEVLSHERGGMGVWVGMVKSLKQRKFDAALVLPRSFSAAFLAWSARIPRRIGYAGSGRTKLLTETPAPLERRHRVYTYHHLLSALGEPPAVTAPRLELPADAIAWAEEKLPGGPWIGFNPGATYGAAKQWFPDRFIELGKKLAKRGKLVVVGGPAEAELGEKVAKGVDGLCIAGKTSVSQLAAAIARCRLFVTNDTGPMHVADAVGAPMVALFGPTDWIVTPPYGKTHTIVRHEIECSPCLKRICPLGHHECMKKIDVGQVLRACEERLK
ncbi:MAG TPA: lipopolysaccharide heptosyltransferase II [Planctomycetota bacterium]|nr:lipopolysaccharide heptosyltransferase II [Planctomycetota bacterium]